jgi:hypothetical protein
MKRQSRWMWLLILGAAVASVLLLVIVWEGASEEARGLLVLAGSVFNATTIVGGYLLQRRLHW